MGLQETLRGVNFRLPRPNLRLPWTRPLYEGLKQPLVGEDQDSDSEPESESLDKQIVIPNATPRKWRVRLLGFVACLGLIVILTFSAYLVRHARWGHHEDTMPKVKTCQDSELSLRKEWGELSKVEQREYIQAVKCMFGRPSKTRPTGSLFDDFAYINAQPGMHTYGVASFLPWHRYFLHIYERDLREQCSYHGNLTYWDWTKNWESLAESSVFTDMPGFGGDGDGRTPSVSGATCVADGNFASKHVAFDFVDGFGIQPKDHCLSRNFSGGGDPSGRQPGAAVKPSVIREILDLPDYESFSVALQRRLADPVEDWVGGDFSLYTAPNDPLYILHLVNLDRLWWIWQHIDPLTRFDEYAGLMRHDFDTPATLEDTITLGTLLAPDIKVMDAMWGQLGTICYTYYL